MDTRGRAGPAVVLAFIVSLIAACRGAEHGGAPVASSDTTVTGPAGALSKLDWQFVGVPLEEKHIEALAVDPEIDGRWYAWSISSGVFVSTDAGATWRHVLSASL